MTWYVSKLAGGHQGGVADEATGRTVAVTYDIADAPLVAAAPELLAALVKCLAGLNTAMERSEGDTFGIAHNSVMDAMSDAERAISKAKGEQ